MCWVCGAHDKEMVRTADKIRLQVFADKSLWIPESASLCVAHVHKQRLKKDVVITSVASQLQPVPSTDVASLLKKTLDAHFMNHGRDSKFSFDDESLNDSQYWSLTGVSKSQFEDLLEHVGKRIRTSGNRSKRDVLGVFLMKLRTGMSHSEIASLFRMSIKTIHNCVRSSRQAFLAKGGFVEQNIGVKHTSRENLIRNHTTTFAKALFGENKLILVEDGTYIYIQKSSDYLFARHTLSAYKHRYLLKPMVCCTTDGYFVDIFGPYLADQKNTDACIFKQQNEEVVQNDASSLRSLLQAGDTFILDRGFRGVDSTCEHVDVQMPAFDDESGQQNTLEANRSRTVTKIRWVVESANCRLKQFKFLSRVVTNSQLRFVGDYCRIVGAICNKYRPALATDLPQHTEMAQKMKQRLSKQNELKQRCQKGGDLYSKAAEKWKPLKGGAVEGFPLLTELDIEQELTFGYYQIAQARSYVTEHLDEFGEFTLERAIYNEDEEKKRKKQKQATTHVVHTRLKSRHLSDTKYHTYIQYSTDTKCAPWERILAWYCTCACGSRCLGCCAHVTAAIWWLAVGRLAPPKFKRNVWKNIVDASGLFSAKTYQNDVVRSEAMQEYHSDCTSIESDNDTNASDSDDDSCSDHLYVPSPAKTANDNAPSQGATVFEALTSSQVVVRIEQIQRQPLPHANQATSNQIRAKRRKVTTVPVHDVDSDPRAQLISEESALVKKNFSNKAKTIIIETQSSTVISEFRLTTRESAKAREVRQFILDNLVWFDDATLGGVHRFELRLSHLRALLAHKSPESMWLSSAIIDGYLAILSSTHAHTCFVPTSFWSAYKSNTQAHVARQLWNNYACKAPYTLIPVHMEWGHWCLIVIDGENKRIAHYDPVGSIDPAPEMLQLKKFVTSISDSQASSSNITPSIDDFKLADKIISPRISQPDAFNCGTVCLLIAEKICLQDKTVISPKTEHLQKYRDLIMLQLCKHMSNT
jgi:hypothetical protein